MAKSKNKALAVAKEENRKLKKKEFLNREWYSLRSIMGYDWAMFYFLLGGREAGKSYAVTNYFVGQYKRYKRPFYWMRLTANSARKLLTNNAEKLVDPDLRRKYDLDLVTSSENVYNVLERDENGKVKRKELMAKVLDLSTFYNDKGSGYFDNEFLDNPRMYYNICLDEMNREKDERNSFDIVYSFTNQLENVVRSTKKRLRIICIGNTLEEASDILCAFNFLPEEFGRFKLKKKRAVIEYIEPSQKYLERRKGTVADILMPTASTFTNKIEVDSTLVSKERLIRPSYVIKFFKSPDAMFTVWNSNVVAMYHNEHASVRAMRPYLDEVFSVENQRNIIELFDSRSFRFRDLITFKRFQKEMHLLKPRQ